MNESTHFIKQMRAYRWQQKVMFNVESVFLLFQTSPYTQ